jgi:hypothetical protein
MAKTRVRPPKSDAPPQPPCVGPFWSARAGDGGILLIAHNCALDLAEKYGDCLTSPQGHYDLWEAWRIAAPSKELAVIVHDAEYEEWPRGRVVFNIVQEQFVIYGDRQVLKHKLLPRILDRFGIATDQMKFTFATDEHYQSTRSLGPR